MSDQQSRIYKVLDYIQNHLNENLSLDILAEQSTYSSFHFHRLFVEVMNETPADYVKRVRMEKAAHMLIYMPNMPVTEIAFECGFTSLSYFTTSFKEYFKSSPKAWREGGYLEKFSKPYFHSKKSKQISKYEEENAESQHYNQFQRINLESVKVIELPERKFVYKSRFGAYSEEVRQTWEGVYHWAKARDLLNEGVTAVGLPQNNPYITPPDKCRYDCCVEVPSSVNTRTELEMVIIPGGKYVFYELEQPVDFSERPYLIECYAELYSVWLPRSGYRYLGNPVEFVQLQEIPGLLDLECRVQTIALPIEPK
ncbi:GyrI-like domain-containing protein [Fictibacillus iocasae]|uniref:GyrI-like domain-containing protein n=1 Tax=Fictibacillus iocasae TaxID=2715437 RepID=A0ABW2NRI2_9BACL